MSTVFASARLAALARAEAVARQNPGHTITRVAVKSDTSCGYEVTTRMMYEEACSESEWIGQATAVLEGTTMHSFFEP